MVADGYKDTEIGVIPVEWDIVKLDSLGKIITGSTPKTSNQDFYLYGTRLWASPSDLGKSKEVKTTNTKLSDLGFEQIRVLDKRSILITCIGSTIGKMGIAYEEMSSNQQINAITCNKDNNPDFYYYVLSKIKNKIKKLAGTHAIPMLNKTDFSQIKVINPSLKEQEKIADILSAADDKIDAIATQIEKAETLKKGLLQKLLSEGIGHSEFKDSELGKIPESWEVVKLNTICQVKGRIGFRGYTKADLVQKGQGALTIGAKHIGKSNSLDFSDPEYISWKKYEESPEIKVEEGHILFVQRGSLGKVALVENLTEPATINPSMVLLKNISCNTKFFFYNLIASAIQKEVQKIMTSTAVPMISQLQIKDFIIPLPPLEEQKQISDILSTADEKLEVLRAKREKYEILKRGLLQKLLSGEVRV